MSEILISNVSKAYGKNNDIFVVKNLSLTIHKGTVFGFIGPNGAGKTSTIKMLVGLSKPTAGTISIAGGLPNDMKVKSHIGFMPESPTFYQYLTGQEFLEFIANIFDIKNKNKRIHDVLKEVNLEDAKDKKIRNYSKGMLQRLGLAQAIINSPDTLFLDEPLDGLDPLGRAEVKKIILDLKKEGKTVFLNTHILGDVAEICDLVGVIDHGTLIALDTPNNLSKGYRDLEDAFVHMIKESRQKSLPINE